MTLVDCLSGVGFAPDEATLQARIETRLRASGFDFRREHILSARDRVDFFVRNTAVEVKLDRSRNAVLEQLIRYAEHDSVADLVLVTTKAQHRRMPGAILGKPLRVVYVGRPF